jgi:simple sugar transport system permease protein
VSDEQIPAKGQTPEPEDAIDQVPAPQRDAAGTGTSEPPPAANRVLHEVLSSSWLISVLAVVVALVVGAVLIAATDPDVQAKAAYFFARPGDTLAAIWDAVAGAYISLFQGAVFNPRLGDFVKAIKPLTETLTFATPLITAGLGVALTFRVGMFNIGGRGQILIAAAAAGWVSWSFELPAVLHIVIATAAGFIGGAIWAGIAGVLKARTGAHEVIVTIMLNYVAFYLISFLLKTQGALQAPGSNTPKSPPANESATYPTLSDLLRVLGSPEPGTFRLHLGFIFAILATIWVWYLLNRSSMGFRFRAVGENPRAASTAGINVKTVYVVAMLFSGGLLGLAGASQVLGTTTTGFAAGVDAGIGFDAITVALLGRSRPWGVFFAGILFGALKSGGYAMQAAQGVPIDIVLVVQSVIVLLIAAPPLVRTIFRLPKPAGAPDPVRIRAQKAVTK